MNIFSCISRGRSLSGPPTLFFWPSCHSLTTVQQQRLSRKTWGKTLVWMIEEQGMPEPEPEQYARILDYLGTYLAPDSPR